MSKLSVKQTNEVELSNPRELSIEERYKKKTLHQHILSIPDTYIGSIVPDERPLYVYDLDQNIIVEENIEYIAGYYKTFDELIVNAADHSRNDSSCRNIKITLNRETGEIRVWNDGHGIGICVHDDYKIYLPELLFANLLTSGNYDKKGKITGGKNGFGAKLANIYSNQFTLHIVGQDKLGKKHEYIQVFENNMYTINKPIIKSVDQKTKEYTEIIYQPDYEKFGMTGMTEDMYRLLTKRCYDIAGCTDSNVTVTLNGEEIKMKTFKDYVALYYDEKPKIIHRKVNSRWEIAIVFDPEIGNRHFSFVNNISTYNGGTHVDHVRDMLVKKVIEHINLIPKHKNLKIHPYIVKQYLTFFINCTIEDPSFSAQVKDCLNSKVSDWCQCGNNCADAKCEITSDLVKDICATGLIDEVVSMSEFKEQSQLHKTDGKKIGLVNVKKLVDAGWAGGRNSSKASLILTEGDSAKSFAIAGMSIIGNDAYGVFPLRGKLLNVRNAGVKQIEKNEEFKNLKIILGLKQGMRYTDTSKLRYGSIIILTDQDLDGSHIKGLIMNMFEHFWPSLLKIKGFMRTLMTPIVKTWKKTDKKRENMNIFYTLTEFHNWVKNTCNGDLSRWDYKYYKGLGTSGPAEAKESFKNFDQRLINYIWESECTDVLDSDDEREAILKSPSHRSLCKAFDKKQVGERKLWVKKIKRDNILEYQGGVDVPISEFIDKDLIHFSNHDNDRSIPNLIDNFKPSQRKILCACFKKGRDAKESKVSQLGGYVSENTEYHHGEQSLYTTIVGLAQNFPGSNNINLLYPDGDFGNRRAGGDEYSQPRYLYTCLTPITNKIFRSEDDDILTYVEDDGKQIEPIYYMPIIPMVLINGCSGVGTGYSTKILPYNPQDVVTNLFRLLRGEKPIEMIPWYNGYKGAVEKVADRKYQFRGIYNIDNQTVRVTEIPILSGTIDHYLEKMKDKVSTSKDDNLKLEKVTEISYLNEVDITVTFKGQELQQLVKKPDELEKFLGMTQSITITNQHLFNRQCQLTRYDTPEDILLEFFDYRLEMYEKRKAHLIVKLQNEMNIYRYKVLFIKEAQADIIKIHHQTSANVTKQLKERNYPELSYGLTSKKSYDYLTSMAIISFTDDKIKELEAKRNECEVQYNFYVNTSARKLWEIELNEFLVAYKQFLEEWSDNMLDVEKADKKKKKSVKKTKSESAPNNLHK